MGSSHKRKGDVKGQRNVQGTRMMACAASNGTNGVLSSNGYVEDRPNRGRSYGKVDWK
jgi:hypothetical protein